MNQDWQVQLEQARSLLRQGYYGQAVAIGGQILESLFRWLYQEIMPRLTAQEHEAVTKALADFGKSVDELTLGQLFGLFKRAKLLDTAEKKLRRDFKMLGAVDQWIELRNRAAHPGGLPITSSEAEAFLSWVNLCLERASFKAPPTPPTGPLRPWHQIVTPRADIREGRLDESVFAADLSDVVAGRAPQEYRDALTFFSRTYLTRGLQRLIATVVACLAGKPGEHVIQLQTPFGGGKTHSLITLYHLFKSRPEPETLPALRPILSDIGLPALPQAQVAVFVGTAPDPLRGRTPWGAIAEQLGKYELIREHDERRLAPGKDLLYELLKDEPTLILMDEITEYVVRCVEPKLLEEAPSSEAARAYQTQVLAFLQELTETVKTLPQCALVVTLPSSAPYGEEGERAHYRIQQIFGRMEAIYTPVEGEEIYEVIRRRLFDNVPEPAEVRQVVESYTAMYQKLGDDVPAQVRESSYQDRMLKAYPFHPQVIDILLERWSTFSTFQRTRGVLRFLGLVISDLYQQRHPAPLIQPAHINLANPQIRRELLKHIGNEYEGVLSSDIADSNAKAQRLDQELGSEYKRFGIATGLATAIFFASFSGGERRGVGTPELRLALLWGDISSQLVGDALKRLEEELWYLHVEGGRYWFSSQPNLNRILAQREDEVQEPQIQEEFRAILKDLAGKELLTYLCPQEPGEVPDRRELQLVILSPEFSRPGERAEGEARKFLERSGSVPRVYRNALLVLVADSNGWNEARTKLKRFLALKSVREDKVLWNQLPEENRKDVERRIRDLGGAVKDSLRRTYRHIAKAGIGMGGIEWLDMGLPTAAEQRSLAAMVLNYLRTEDKLALELAPQRLLEKALRPDETEKPVSDILEAFRRYPELPMVETDEVVKRSIIRGVKEGLFGLRVGSQIFYGRDVPPQELEYGAVLVRKEALPPKEPEVEVKPEEVSVTEAKRTSPVQEPKTFPVALSQPQEHPFRLRARIPWDKLPDFMRGVLRPLHEKGATIELEIKLEARATGEPIEKSTINIVEETLKQINAQILEKEL